MNSLLSCVLLASILNMGHSALGAADLDLPEHGLLLNGICFFHYELKMSEQPEHLPRYRNLDPSFVWWAPGGLCHSVSSGFMVGGFCTETDLLGFDERRICLA